MSYIASLDLAIFLVLCKGGLPISKFVEVSSYYLIFSLLNFWVIPSLVLLKQIRAVLPRNQVKEDSFLSHKLCMYGIRLMPTIRELSKLNTLQIIFSTFVIVLVSITT